MYPYTLYVHEVLQELRRSEFEREGARQRRLREARHGGGTDRSAPRWAYLLTLLFAW